MSEVPVMIKSKQIGTMQKSEEPDPADARQANIVNALTAFPSLYAGLMSGPTSFSLPLSDVALVFCSLPTGKMILRTITDAISKALGADAQFSEDLLARVLTPQA